MRCCRLLLVLFDSGNDIKFEDGNTLNHPQVTFLCCAFSCFWFHVQVFTYNTGLKHITQMFCFIDMPKNS